MGLKIFANTTINAFSSPTLQMPPNMDTKFLDKKQERVAFLEGEYCSVDLTCILKTTKTYMGTIQILQCL